MRANAPVYWDGAACGASPATTTCRTCRTDPTTFSNAGGIRPDTGPIPMMIDMDDPDHWPRRKLVNRGFTPRRVRDQRGHASAQVCDEIIDAVCERGECDFVCDIAALAAADHDRRRPRRRARGPPARCCGGPTT